MANFNNNSNGFGGSRGSQSYDNRGQGNFAAPVASPKPKAEVVPVDYATAAEKAVSASGSYITTSKIRNFFSMFCDMYNDVRRENNTELTPTQITELTGARIRMIYECGRDNNVKTFVDSAKLINYLLGIGKSAQDFIRFYHYFEALVAYHRYYGNK